MSAARVFAFRQRASQAHDKAKRAGIPETTQRAWLIIERDWIRMAEREELKDGALRQVQTALRKLANKSLRRPAHDPSHHSLMAVE